MCSLWSLISMCFSFLLHSFLYQKNMVSTNTLPINMRKSQTIYTCPESLQSNVLVSTAEGLGRWLSSYEDVISLSTIVWSVIILPFSIFSLALISNGYNLHTCLNYYLRITKSRFQDCYRFVIIFWSQWKT